VLSDHGQSQGATFLQRYGETLERLVARHVDGTRVHAEVGGGEEGRGSFDAGLTELASRPTVTGRTAKALAGADGDRADAREQVPAGEPPPEIAVMASGNLGLISFPREPGRVTLEQIEARRPSLLDALRSHPGIGFVLVRSERDGAVVLGRDGRHVLATGAVEGEDPLAPFGGRAAEHVRRTDAFAACPDVVVNSAYWEGLDEVAAFEELVGSHGGLGGGQAHPFVLHPAELPWPAQDVVGAEAVHRVLCGWLAQLGQDDYAPYSESASPTASVATRTDGAARAT
jgi:hypothetical protein